MSFIAEDGTGLAAANSYISVDDADDYFADRAAEDWAAAETADRQAALVAATDYMDATFAWRGYLKAEGQALGWPRSAARDEEGRLLTGVPTVVAAAACELARAALTSPLLPTSDRGGAVTERREKVGELEVEVRYVPSAQAERCFSLVHRMLRGVSRARTGGATAALIRS